MEQNNYDNNYDFYEIDENIYHRFDQKNQMIFRYLWDKNLKTYKNNFSKDMLQNIKNGKEGYTHIDYAFLKASWAVYNRFPFAFSWEGDISLKEDWYGYCLREEKYEISNPSNFTAKVKKIARFYGASSVGITRINDKWIYKTGESKTGTYPINIPEKINTAIVMTVEMNRLSLSTTPALPAGAATGLGYSKMAFLVACLGEFIRNLGYAAIQSGNDTALSIPLAIDAGLGALGRNSLLVTPEYGSRVRICKIFTDLPLVTDEPNRKFIKYLSEICRECCKCAEGCENDSISFKKEPDFKGESFSNNFGVRKYYINPEKCFKFWAENNADCSTCITVCPFSEIKHSFSSKEFWMK